MITLTKISETQFKITLGWTPVPGAIGYRFQSSLQAPKWSHSWDGNRSQVQFAKADWYKVEALGVEAAGHYPAAAPVPSFDIPHWSSILSPPSNQIAAWRRYASPTTMPNLHPSGGSTVIATPAAVYSGINKKSWVWWFCASVVIPASFPSHSGSFSVNDWHTTSIDVGDGLGWKWGDGVAPVHLFWHPGSNEIRLQHQANFPNHVFPVVRGVVRGKRYDFMGRMILGRLDSELGLAGPGNPGGGIGDHPNDGAGETDIWVNGAHALNTGKIDNLYRIQKTPESIFPADRHRTTPDNKWYTMTMFERAWDGLYKQGGLTAQVSVENFVTRVGLTPEEALSDGVQSGFVLQSTLIGSGADGNGSARHTSLVPLKSSEFVAPIL